jgi:hypothetical protein
MNMREHLLGVHVKQEHEKAPSWGTYNAHHTSWRRAAPTNVDVSGGVHLFINTVVQQHMGKA